MNRTTLQRLNELYRAGRARLVPNTEVEKKVKTLKKSNHQLQSNDIHILGLAKASNTKVLCTKDKKLHQDFKKIIKGKVYQNKKHQHLLTLNLFI